MAGSLLRGSLRGCDEDESQVTIDCALREMVGFSGAVVSPQRWSAGLSLGVPSGLDRHSASR